MIYNKVNVLSLKLNGMTQLKTLSRAEFFTRLQLIRTVEPTVDLAYRISEAKILKEALDDEPHGEPWHVSFHGSQFPGNDPMACSRRSLYRMMNFPPTEPIPRHLRQTATLGKAIESDIVHAWDNADMLLSSADPDRQTKFELKEAWLTGTVDAVILPPGSKMPLPVEIKQRKAEVLAEMQRGRGPFPEHVSQVKVEIAFVRAFQEAGLWLPVSEGYELTRYGSIYYVSRDDPKVTAEFRIDYDENFWVAGVEKLKRWRANFEEDLLPEDKPGKRSSIFGHPHGWRWSYPPCQWCDFKKTCQLDFREGTTSLSGSIGVRRSQQIRKDYDPEFSKLRVRARWQEKKDNDRDSSDEEQPQEA